MIHYLLSENTIIQKTKNIDIINIFYQFFINKDNERNNELRFCLKQNVLNKYITKIYLLNERIYTDTELGISSNKIIQINIKERIFFKNVFDFIQKFNIYGYNIIINSDIFFDNTISNLFKSDIHINKKMYALVRYEYDGYDIKNSKILQINGDSQDTWILHSNFNILPEQTEIFNFKFGVPGCDNKIVYLMTTLGYSILNDPLFIKSYHYHNTNIRNYNNKDKVKSPYTLILPKFQLTNNNNKKYSL